MRLFSYFIGLVACVLPVAGLTQAREPTEFEQYFLELLNRARTDPLAEVNRLAAEIWGDDPDRVPDTSYPQPQPADLNEGLAAGTISSAPKQPLAFNLQLIDAAADYSEVLLANDAFTHTWNGTTVQTRAEAAGYVFDPPWTWSENLSLQASSVPFSDMAAVVENQHQGLFIDNNVVGRGHRINMMKSDFQEIGIGLGQSSTSGFFPCCSYAVLSTFDLTASSNTPELSGATDGPFLTGVAYDDLDSDQFYSPDGEGIGGLTVDLFLANTVTLMASTTTYASGGYTLEGLTPGTYDVRFHGMGIDQMVRSIEFDGVENLKFDAIDPTRAVLTADFTGDGVVDTSDLAQWQGDFGQNAFSDADTDGDSDGVDFLFWQQQAGQGMALTAGFNSLVVPEPGSLWLLLLAFATCWPVCRVG